jgi:hypothetical protein
VSDAIQVIEQHGQMAPLQRCVRQEHPGRRAHRSEDDDRLMDCLTEACAFAWADLRGLGTPRFDYRTGKPDIFVPPDLWIEAKSIPGGCEIRDISDLAVTEHPNAFQCSATA